MAALAGFIPLPSPATTYYSYDSLGRVTQVTESDGTTTQYTYDANGNVTSITRTAGTTSLTIGSISAISGATGSSVTITGTGFSSIASQDAVTFDGVTAAITYASGNRIVVSVPAGASTGDITITTPNGTTTSANPFTVVPVAISAFTPGSGSDNASVTVTGSGFDPTASNDAVSLNGLPATVTSASPTELQFSVPSGATSGHIAITAPLGSASSIGHFFVPAPGYTLSQVSSVADLSPGGSGQIYTIDNPSQVAAALFDGSQGQMMTIALTNVTMGGTYTVYSPNGSSLSTGSVANNDFIALPALPLSGTYSLYLAPSASVGTATASVQTDATGTLPTNGTPTPVTLVTAQNASYTFAGIAGQSYSLELTQYSSPVHATLVATILNSDGTVAAGCGYYDSAENVPGNCDFTLPNSATYTVHLAQGGLYPSSFNVLLNQDFTATLTSGTPGPTVDISLAAGQHGLLNFSATAAQTLAFYLGSVVVSPSNQDVAFSIHGPTGLDVGDAQAFNYRSATLNLTNLAAGTYSVLIRPDNLNSATTTMQVALANGVTGTVPTDGTSTSFQTYVPGQSVYLSLAGTAGQSLGLGLMALTLNPSSTTYSLINISKPDGTALTSAACYTSSTPGCQMSLQNLPLTGNYSVVISPYGQATQAFTFAASQDVVGTLALSQSDDISLSSPGQYGDFTFTANGAQPLVLYVGALSMSPANSAVLLYVYNSSGTLVTQASVTSGSTSVNLGTLAAGTYTVLAVPNNAATGTLQLALQPNATATLPSNGTTVQVATNASGQAAYLSFSANSGQMLSLAVTGLTLTPTSVSSVTLAISNPDGSALTTATCSTSTPGCEIRLRKLPQSGTYTAVVQPGGQATMNFGATLSSDQTGTLTLGTPINIGLQSPGQASSLSFTLSTPQTVAIDLSSLSFSPANIPVSEYVYASSGSLIGSMTPNSGTALTLPNVPADTYTVEIVPQYPVTGSFQASLASGTATSAVSTSTPGQNAYVSFYGTAGEDLGLGITALTLNPNSSPYATLLVTEPNGSTQIVNTYIYGTNPGGGSNFNLLNLPATGTYTIRVIPWTSQQTMSFNLTLSQPVTGSLSLNTPQSVSLLQGQYTWLTFTATAGQAVAINESSIATTPASQNVQLTAYNSSGSSIGTVGSGSGITATLNLANLAAGTYYVLASPAYASAATLQLTLGAGVSAAQSVNGSATSYSTSEPGQNAYIQFSGTAGEDIGIGITGLTLTPNSQNFVDFYVIEPNGTTQLLSTYAYGTNPGGGNNFNLMNLPVTGTYTIELAPPNAQEKMSFNLTLSQPVTGGLTLNTPQSVNLVPGQYTWLSFTATAGQTVVINEGTIATTPAAQNVQLIAYNSSGSSIGSTGSGSGTTATLNLPNLAAGTYYVMASPSYAAAATLQLTVASGVAVSQPTDGSTPSYSTSEPGQNAYIQFSGTAGENIGLGITALKLNPNSSPYATLVVTEPNGTTQLVNAYLYGTNPGGGNNFALRNLPTTGTYTVELIPWTSQQTMSFNLTLSQPVTNSLSLDTPQSINLVAGQYTWLTFTATAGQGVEVSASSIVTTPASQNVQLTVYNASGTSVGSAGSGSGSAATLTLTNLAAGTYYVMASPSYAAAATLQLGIQ